MKDRPAAEELPQDADYLTFYKKQQACIRKIHYEATIFTAFVLQSRRSAGLTGPDVRSECARDV